ncbi:hypothetical protein CspeluHIS016_0203580 [Cutaneotrichosporon spelunceum]|uniref:Nitrogen permease regulator 3 n=1 Tax=Cutaneotrichosporon spelunceum TaxID=1672016 RepID=A0AAD3TRS0_9TREE|nr:hypothetical protein CspeluHIS016_0203580 [Cutaneotrichosporon spelunceum]
MADYLLGIMLVAQSSRDRHVFRYPPDPTSPSDRLSQPIYSRATYTAQDNTVDRSMNGTRFFRDGSRGGRLRSGLGGAGVSGLSGFSAGLDEGSLVRTMTGPSGSAHSIATENGSPVSSSSSSSDESDIDAIWGPTTYRARPGYGHGNIPHAKAHNHGHGHGHVHGRSYSHGALHPRRYSSESEGRSGLANSVTKGFTEIKPNPDRRGSVISTETVKKKHHVTPLEHQYNFSMGYALDFLSDLLSPRRAACHRKFIITINELIFLGHPVCSGSDGKWAYPAGDSDDEEDSRLRGRRKEAGPVKAVEVIQKIEETPARTGRKDEACLNMFHLVLILDKPDPKPNQALADCLEILYREVAFKWTAAAFALQVRDNWVGREVKKLMTIRERGMADGIPVNECLRLCIEKSELAQSLHELYGALHKIKSRPLNGHFARVSTTIKVPVGPIPITLVVPPKTTDVEALMAESDSDSDSDMDAWEFAGPDGALIAKQPGFRVEPWKTLLLLEDDEIRPGRRKQAEDEDLLDMLVSHCDVSKPLHEIAHLMRCDLEGVVIPLARELVQNKRAVFIDVVNIRLRTILMPTSIENHLRSITQHSVRFSVAFPNLPPLIPLMSTISSAPVPFRDLLPPDALTNPSRREPWMRAIVWLLRNDLVMQAHVRARVIASASVKEAAWLKFWHRRRRRWLRERKLSGASGGASGGSARSRPSFGETSAAQMVMAAAANKATSPDRPDRLSDRDRGDWAARVPKIPLAVTRTMSVGTADVDSEYDLSSDDDDERWRLLRPPLGPGMDHTVVAYSLDEAEPTAMPTFGASFIFHPAQAHKDEARWLRVVRERTPDPVLRSRFDLCVQYFDGVTSFEEIVFRTGLTRRELNRIALVYRDDLMITVHP